MARFAKKGTTKQDIIDKMKSQLSQSADFTKLNNNWQQKLMNIGFDELVYEWLNYCMRYNDKVNPKAFKDCQKINFDWENADKCSLNLPEQLPDGTAIVWCLAGGDWEWPVNFVIYIDPSNTFRAYIPSDGNVYCHHCKTAYGSCECDEGAEEEEQFETNGDPQPDCQKMATDAFNRIQTK